MPPLLRKKCELLQRPTRGWAPTYINLRPPPPLRLHIAQQGESLQSIAATHSADTGRTRAANPEVIQVPMTTSLQPGWVVQLPGGLGGLGGLTLVGCVSIAAGSV